MFTGIIQKVGKIVETHTNSANAKNAMLVEIESGWNDLALGESIAVNGVCLTVTETNQDRARFFISTETLDCSNLKKLEIGNRVNLERALQVSDRLSGHLVQGHVDGVARLSQVTYHDESFELHFELSGPLGRYCVKKGSISLNGVSLTLNSVDDRADATVVGVMIIPHTWNYTNLSALQPGDLVNVEVDVLAKYVERLCRNYPMPSNS